MTIAICGAVLRPPRPYPGLISTARANAAPRPASRQLTAHQAKRHYRKKCPIFFWVIGIIVIGLRRALRHTSGVPRCVLDKDKRAGVFRHPLQEAHARCFIRGKGSRAQLVCAWLTARTTQGFARRRQQVLIRMRRLNC